MLLRVSKGNRKTLHQQYEIQDKRGITISTGTDPARASSTRDVKGKPRYDVGRSNKVVRDDTVVQTIFLKHLFLI